MKKYQKGKNPWILGLGILLIMSILFTKCSSGEQNKLNVYTESDVISTEQEITTEEKKIDTFTYEDNTYGFKVLIPSEWEMVTKDGFDTYIHTPSASSIQIQVKEYDPNINSCNAESLSEEIVNNGYTFINFARLTNTSYEISYQDKQTNAYDYIEDVYWNKNCIVILKCTFNDINYEKIYPYYKKILNSFSWTNEDTIQEGFLLYYSEIADFEFGIPSNWYISASGNSIVAMSEDNLAQMTVSVQEYTDNLSNFTATDMTNLIKYGKNAFMLKEFNNNYVSAVSTATYTNGDSMTNKTYLYANGFFLYSIQFDYYTGSIEDTVPQSCAALFREFLTEKTTQNAKDTTEELSSETTEE